MNEFHRPNISIEGEHIVPVVSRSTKCFQEARYVSFLFLISFFFHQRNFKMIDVQIMAVTFCIRIFERCCNKEIAQKRYFL